MCFWMCYWLGGILQCSIDDYVTNNFYFKSRCQVYISCHGSGQPAATPMKYKQPIYEMSKLQRQQEVMHCS